MDLTDQFQKFAGCEVAFKTDFGGSLVPDDNDPVIIEINALATRNGLVADFQYPGIFQAGIYDPSRLTID